jgi:Asp-tRNA(Asn)/Glu-tRNA(Gln) amidotransferase A subunit family amidase
LFTEEYLEHWNSQPDIDVLLCPVGSGVAPLHETSRYRGYTAVFNCLYYPACAFPTGMSVLAEEHPKDTNYIPLSNEFDAYNWNHYDPELYKDAPVSLQLVGRKWDCERVVQAMRRIEEVLAANKSSI